MRGRSMRFIEVYVLNYPDRKGLIHVINLFCGISLFDFTLLHCMNKELNG
jgi:hypothetical protein